jgi:hypothetical protein
MRSGTSRTIMSWRCALSSVSHPVTVV